jgi:hypothetical protein
MNAHQAYVTLDASNWPSMSRQVKAAVSDCWHQHAGRWQPETISLHVATRLLPDAADAAQRETHLPQLVAWLRQQGHAITLLGDRHLLEHRLYLNPPTSS